MLVVVIVPRSVLAQSPYKISFPLIYVDNEPGQIANATFSAPFGRLLVAEFAAVLADSADAACLNAK